ncbi:Flp family type IVb pilin [Nocardiopsis mangrovi]|uniref:Flp family type IVb pilin n=1 Tax=Nocardiopsis mangrovi TaxID=1179818 RepID=A0ABV9DXM5_9ACTN
MRRTFRVPLHSEHGATYVEYGAVILLVAAILAVVAGPVSTRVRDFLDGALDGVTASGETGEPRPDRTGPPAPAPQRPEGDEPPASGDEPAPGIDPDHPDIDQGSTWPAGHASTAANYDPGGGGPPEEEGPLFVDPGPSPQFDAFEISEDDFESEGQGKVSPGCWPWSDDCCPGRTCTTLGEVRDVIRAVEFACFTGWDRLASRCLPDAADYFDHFLNGNGEPVELDMDRFMDDLPEFEEAVGDHQDELVATAIAEAEDQGADGPVTFPISTEWRNYGYPPDDINGTDFVYADTNWANAIGSFHYNLTGEVTVTPPADPGGEWTYEISTDVNLEKMYDWERDEDSNALNGLPGELWAFSQSDLAELHQWGMAEEFWIEGSHNVTRTG